MRAFALIFYAVVLGSVAVSDVGAQLTWSPENNIPASETRSVFVQEDTMFIATARTVHRHPLGTSIWLAGNQIADTIDISTCYRFGTRVFAGTFGHGVFESTDGGQTWIARSTGLTGVGASSIVDFTVRGDSLYVGTDGASVFVLDLNGATIWTPYRNGIPWNTGYTCLAIHTHGPNLLLGAGQSANIYRNPDTTTQWEEIQFGPFIPTGLGMVAIGHTDTLLIGGAFNGIYTSTDSGTTWTRFATPFSAASAGAVVVTPQQVFVMLSHGTQGTFIYELTSSGWVLFDHQPGVLAVDMAYADGRLWLTRFDGLYYAPLNPTGIGDGDPLLPGAVTLAQNYPNPFNPSTTIEFNLARRTAVELNIYNLLGRQVRSLVADVLPAGGHAIEWDGRDDDGKPVASGVYLYRLVGDERSETRKMLLLK